MDNRLIYGINNSDISTIFFFLLEHRSEIMTTYSLEEKKYVIQVLTKLLNTTHKLRPRIIELTAVIYKWLPITERRILCEIVWKIAMLENDNPSHIVAVCNFIWINYRAMDCAEQISATKILEFYESTVPVELKDTVSHTAISLQFSFERNVGINPKTIIVIPEFLSGLSFVQPPIGLMTSASIPDKYKINSDLLDNRVYHYDEKTLCGKLKDYSIIVVNTTPIDQVQNYFVDYRFDITLKLLKEIRKLYPQKIVIICGSHGTVRPEIIEQYNVADIILRGEYDYQLPNLIKSIYNRVPYNTIANISYKDNQGAYIHTIDDQKQAHPELDNEFYPDYNKIHIEQYYGNVHYKNINVKKNNWSILMTSRGCPYQCSFCYKFFGNNIRKYSIEHVIQELNNMHRAGISDFFIIDQLFTSNEYDLISLCNAIRALPFRFNWSCQTRIDKINARMLNAMKKAGCKAVWLGVESVDDDVLTQNKKGISKKQILTCLEMIQKAKIEFNVFFMLGMMGDTPQSIDAIKDFIITHNLPCTKSIMICTPRYGTEMGEFAIKEYNLSCDNFSVLNKYKGVVNNHVSQDYINKTIEEISSR